MKMSDGGAGPYKVCLVPTEHVWSPRSMLPSAGPHRNRPESISIFVKLIKSFDPKSGDRGDHEDQWGPSTFWERGFSESWACLGRLRGHQWAGTRWSARSPYWSA